MRVPIKIGISSCLLGEGVRYDGGNKRDSYIVDILGKYFEWVPVCPEVEAGLGVPRPPLNLRDIDGDVRVIQVGTGADYTKILRSFSEKRVEELKKSNLSGYLLKSRSPSCGTEGIGIYTGHEESCSMTGIGIFARALMRIFPNLPIEDEARFSDLDHRENWLNRVYAYHRFRMENR